MLDLVLATLFFTVVFALGLAVLYAVTALPFALTSQLAEQRGLAPGRWGLIACAGIGLGLLLAAAVYRAEGPPNWQAVIPLALTFAGPVLAVLTDERKQRVHGPGRHQ